MLIALPLSLFLTLLLEEGFALIFRVRIRKDLLLVALVNILTNPPLGFLHYVAALYLHSAAPVLLLLLEITAVLGEWRCYFYYSENIPSPFWFSLAANVFSFCIGGMIDRFLF